MDVETLLLTMPYYICALAAWGTMMTCTVAAAKGIFPHRILFLAGGLLLIGAMFFLLAASARQGGYIDRATVAWVLRALASAGGVLWLVWLGLLLRAMVRVERRPAKQSPAAE